MRKTDRVKITCFYVYCLALHIDRKHVVMPVVAEYWPEAARGRITKMLSMEVYRNDTHERKV